MSQDDRPGDGDSGDHAHRCRHRATCGGAPLLPRKRSAIVGSIPIALSVWTLIALIAEEAFTRSALTTPIAAALFLVLTPSIYIAAFLRGRWWFPLLGIAVTTRTGRRASRMLSFWRAVIAWLPSLAFSGGVMLDIPWVAAPAAVLIAVGIVSAVLTPDRGLHDRLLGTRLVRQ